MCSAAHGKLVGSSLGQDTVQGGILSCQFLSRFPRITLLCDLETDPPSGLLQVWVSLKSFVLFVSQVMCYPPSCFLVCHYLAGKFR